MSAFDYSISYHISSDLGEESPKKYINSIEAEIFVNAMSGTTLKVGRVFLKIILVTQARKKQYDFQKIFNSYDSTKDLAKNILCIPLDDFEAPLTIYHSSCDFKTDICLIETIELLPAFRGKGLGQDVLNDIVHRFGPMCSAFFIQAIPYQLNTIKTLTQNKDDLDDFSEQMDYGDSKFDEEGAIYKLYAFFQKSGFDILNDGYFVLENHPVVEI